MVVNVELRCCCLMQKQYDLPYFQYINQKMSKAKVVHRFIRSANIESSKWNRIANRFDPFNNTLTTLSDPANQRTLTLIGTTNSSTTLAQRTKQLLEKIQPDAVYVQASPQWWNYAKNVNVQNQQTFHKIAKDFPQAPYKFQNHLRGILFRARYLSWKYTFETCLKLPQDFQLLRPGLQTYYAIKHAQAKNAQTIFGGVAFDPITIQALRLQPDLYFHSFLYRAIHSNFNEASSWTGQYEDLIDTLHVRGGQAFAQSMDRSRINFIVAILSKVIPKQKKILIDDRDIRIFRDIYNLKAKNIVAVVNQWHMQGIETHWRSLTGTQVPKEHLSPIADMDIDAVQQKLLVNEWLREYTSEVTKSQPATWQDYLTNYHKQNFQYERTRHTDHVTHQDIPAPGETKKHHH